MTQSRLEAEFSELWVSLYPTIDLHSEYKFSSSRRYRFDFAHVASKVAIELHGGTWMKRSAHNSGSGLNRDYSKLNIAVIEGWRVFQFSGEMITDDWLHAIATAINESDVQSHPKFQHPH